MKLQSLSNKPIISNNIALKIFRSSGLTLFIILVLSLGYIFIKNGQIDNGELDLLKRASFIIAPLAILVSALLASYSVLMNIENTNQLETTKNQRLKKRNSIVLINDLEFLLKEIDEQINMMNSSLDDINNYKYTDVQKEKRLFRIAEKITSLDINEYNSIDLVRELGDIQKLIYDGIHTADILFNYIDKINSTEQDPNIKTIIQEFVKSDSIIEREDMSEKQKEERYTRMIQLIIDYQKQTSIRREHYVNLLKIYDNIEKILHWFQTNLPSEKLKIKELVDKLSCN